MGGGARNVLWRGVFAGAALAMVGLLMACELLYTIPVIEGPEGGTHDAGVDVRTDARQVDAGVDQAADTEAPEEAATDAGPTYGSFDSAASWSTFNAEGLTLNASGFAGGTFDGRYVYFAPYENMVAARYDTHATFTTKTSWSKFDTTALFDSADAGIPVDASADAAPGFDAGAPTLEFYGSAFDGKYVYLLPGSDSLPSVAARYDTSGVFTSMAAWESYDLSKLAGGNAYGFGGGAFDGRYVYMVPDYTSIFVRYDTMAAFSGAGWSTFDLSSLDGGAGFDEFTGAVYDGRYLYLVPASYETVAMRLDTQGALDSPSSWSSFDTSQVNLNVLGFAGGVFDGKYLYMVPNENGISVRYDTTQPFSQVPSWSFFNTALVITKGAGGFFGGVFDGRYVYFVPEYKGITFAPGDVVLRYDSTASFFAPTSWETFATQPLDNAAEFMGGIFDGQYVYLVPSNSGATGGLITRFDAKTPPHEPDLPDFHGSFF